MGKLGQLSQLKYEKCIYCHGNTDKVAVFKIIFGISLLFIDRERHMGELFGILLFFIDRACGRESDLRKRAKIPR